MTDAALPEQIRAFNIGLDLSSLESVLKQLGVDRTKARKDTDSDSSFVIDALFLGVNGRITYSPRGADGDSSRLHFHVEDKNPMRLARTALVAAFPGSIFNAAPDGADGVFIIRDEGNIVRFFVNRIEADELDITHVMITGRDGSGAFADSPDNWSPGAPLQIDAIKDFVLRADLCAPEAMLARLNLTSSHVRWLHGREDSGSFLYSGPVFGVVGRLSYTNATDGAELIFLIGEEQLPTASQTSLQAAFPSLDVGPLTDTPPRWCIIARGSPNDVTFSVKTIREEELVVRGMFFHTHRRN